MYIALLQIKKKYYFLLISFFLILIHYITQLCFYTESVYFNTFADTMRAERIAEIMNTRENYQLLGIVLLPLMLIVKVLYNTFFITTATLLSRHRYSFAGNFDVCLKAELTFVAMLLVKMICLFTFKEVTVMNDINFIPGSVFNLFTPSSVPQWTVYPLQTFNIWEVLYCYVGTALYAKKYNISLNKAASIFCAPYIIGLLILMMTFSFITLQLS